MHVNSDHLLGIFYPMRPKFFLQILTSHPGKDIMSLNLQMRKLRLAQEKSFVQSITKPVIVWQTRT